MSHAMPRRDLFGLGAGALAGTALLADAADAAVSAMSQNEAIIHRYYKSWETRDWAPFEAMLANDFTFSSPLDDHIPLAKFKDKCWDSQVDFIKTFDLEVVMAKGDQVAVEYLCHTRNGKGLRNVEIHRLRDGKITSIDCYFGAPASFPSAVSTSKR